jgi:hypothetical protein
MESKTEKKRREGKERGIICSNSLLFQREIYRRFGGKSPGRPVWSTSHPRPFLLVATQILRYMEACTGHQRLQEWVDRMQTEEDSQCNATLLNLRCAHAYRWVHSHASRCLELHSSKRLSGLFGSLLKFAKAMILAIIWFAIKTCQSLTFSLPNRR